MRFSKLILMFFKMMNTRAVTDSNLVQAEITGTLW